jgi:toxin YhaV|tara:strand:- start:477 stop:980 length:504 start_codon:yes stop_codon:yes gene_type:complete
LSLYSSNHHPTIVNGWTLYAHPLFAEQYLILKDKVEELKQQDPTGYVKKNATKRLAAIHKLAFEIIPQDPTSSDYRQGKTLGDNHKHWFRAKFFQRYRLFFRYHVESKIIVYAWVNDEKNKRAYGSKNDAYRVFSKMLMSGQPPDDWDDLLKASTRHFLSNDDELPS